MASTVKLADVVPSRFAHLTPADETNIERIRADLVDGSKILLNVPHVFKNEAGKYELLAGHDRVEAARRAGWTEVQVRDFSGTLNTDDAILAHFCKENLLRKDVSKAAIAGEWLRKHPEWMDTRIAEHSGCVSSYVGEVRAELTAAGAISVPNFRESETGEKRKAYKPRAKPPKAYVPIADRLERAEKSDEKKVKHESAEDIAAALFKKPAPQQVAPAVPSGAEKGAPEPDRGSTDSPGGAVQYPSEVGDTPTGASPALGTEGPEMGLEEDAGAVQLGSKSAQQSGARESVEAPVTETLDVPPAAGSAVREVSAGFAVLAAIAIPTVPLTSAELRAISDAQEAALTSLSRWCQQTVTARRRVLSTEGVAA